MHSDIPSVKTIETSLKPENLLGDGRNGAVYDIPEYPKFCVKVGHNTVRNFENAAYQADADLWLPDYNFGQAVGIYTKGVTLHRKVAGIACGVPKSLRSDQNTDSNNIRYERSYRLLADMPPAAYERLLRDLLVLDSVDRAIDPSSAANLLIDSPDRKMNFIDTIEDKAKRGNWPEDVLTMFFDISYAHNYPDNEKLLSDRKIILNKFLDAAESIAMPLWDTHCPIAGGFSFCLTLAGYPPGSEERNHLMERINRLNNNSKPSEQTWAEAAASSRNRTWAKE